MNFVGHSSIQISKTKLGTVEVLDLGAGNGYWLKYSDQSGSDMCYISDDYDNTLRFAPLVSTDPNTIFYEMVTATGRVGLHIGPGAGEVDMAFTATVGVSTLLGLTDTPSSYAGQVSKVLGVKAGETETEFIEMTGGGGGYKYAKTITLNPDISNDDEVEGEYYNTYADIYAYLSDTGTSSATPSSGGVLTIPDDGRATNHWQGGYLLYSGVRYPITASTSTTITATGLPDSLVSVPYFVSKAGSSNLYNILFSGKITEAVDRLPYTCIVGINRATSIISGAYTYSKGASTDLATVGFVSECDLQNYVGTAGVLSYVFNCFISGGTAATSGILLAFSETSFLGGDLSNLVQCVILDGFIIGGTFASNTSFIDCYCVDQGLTQTYNGGTWSGGRMDVQSGIQTFNAGTYKFYGTMLGLGYSLTLASGVTWELDNVVGDSSSSVSAGSGATINFRDVTNFNISSSGAGVVSDNSISYTNVSSGPTTISNIDYRNQMIVRVLLSTAAITVNLPQYPVDGQEIDFCDMNGLAGTYTITVSQNGSNPVTINGQTSVTITNDYGALTLRFSRQYGWIIISRA
jgi:hypothetical protein